MGIDIIGADRGFIDIDFNRPADAVGFAVGTVDSQTIQALDVYFLVDTTGSMRTTLATVGNRLLQTLSNIKRIFEIESEEQGFVVPDIAYGFGQYKDFVEGSACFGNVLPITRFTEENFDSGIFTQAIAAIASAGSGGGDRPECQIFALNAVATSPAIGWRPVTDQFIGHRLVTWIGDAPGHDPSGGVTTLEAIFNLRNKSINVSGISVGGDGLNDPV